MRRISAIASAASARSARSSAAAGSLPGRAAGCGPRRRCRRSRSESAPARRAGRGASAGAPPPAPPPPGRGRPAAARSAAPPAAPGPAARPPVRAPRGCSGGSRSCSGGRPTTSSPTTSVPHPQRGHGTAPPCRALTGRGHRRPVLAQQHRRAPRAPPAASPASPAGSLPAVSWPPSRVSVSHRVRAAAEQHLVDEPAHPHQQRMEADRDRGHQQSLHPAVGAPPSSVTTASPPANTASTAVTISAPTTTELITRDIDGVRGERGEPALSGSSSESSATTSAARHSPIVNPSVAKPNSSTASTLPLTPSTNQSSRRRAGPWCARTAASRRRPARSTNTTSRTRVRPARQAQQSDRDRHPAAQHGGRRRPAARRSCGPGTTRSSPAGISTPTASPTSAIAGCRQPDSLQQRHHQQRRRGQHEQPAGRHVRSAHRRRPDHRVPGADDQGPDGQLGPGPVDPQRRPGRRPRAPRRPRPATARRRPAPDVPVPARSSTDTGERRSHRRPPRIPAQTAVAGPHHGLGPGRHPQLGEDRGDVVAHRLRAPAAAGRRWSRCCGPGRSGRGSPAPAGSARGTAGSAPAGRPGGSAAGRPPRARSPPGRPPPTGSRPGSRSCSAPLSR